MDDRLLIEKVLAGNPEAFRLLVVRYERPLFRFLGLLGLDQTSAEDTAQETFLRAYRALQDFDASRSSFSSWLFTIAKHLAANERKHRRRRLVDATVEPSKLASGVKSPAEHARMAERMVRLQGAIRSLPEPLRTALVFAQFHEIELEEIAAMQGCAVGTVKSRIHRARVMLRSMLGYEET